MKSASYFPLFYAANVTFLDLLFDLITYWEVVANGIGVEFPFLSTNAFTQKPDRSGKVIVQMDDELTISLCNDTFLFEIKFQTGDVSSTHVLLLKACCIIYRTK